MRVLFLLFLLLGCGQSQMSTLSMEQNVEEMHFFYGNLHSHTAYSDGTGSPEDVYKWARDVIGYDFYAITDHAELLTEKEWVDIGDKTKEFNEDGRFVPIRGFEYTNYLLGHINIFNTSSYRGVFSAPRLRGIYRWIESQPHALAELNHPGSPLGAFGKLTIPETIKDQVFGMETGNGYNRNSSNLFIPFYNLALHAGYYLAPLYNMDNHILDENGCRTVIIAPELTRDSLLEALHARRVYAVDNPSAKVAFKCNGAWMGSRITANAIHCEITASNNKPITQIRVVSDHLDSQQYQFYGDVYEVALTLDLTIAASTFFYLQVFSQEVSRPNSNPELMSITAPIWVEKS